MNLNLSSHLPRLFLFMTSSLIILLFSHSVVAKTSSGYQSAVDWQGQYLNKPNGAFFTRLYLRNFKASSRGNFFASSVIIVLRHKTTNEVIHISQDPQGNVLPKNIWVVPEGIYQLVSISMIDNNGVTRRFASKKPIQRLVKHLYLSDFGDWVIQPYGKRGLKLSFQPPQINYKHRFKHHTFVGVINGKSGKLRKLLGGSSIIQKSKGEFSSAREARASYTVTRQILLKYQIDLGKDNNKGNVIMSVLTQRDIDLRQCYLALLDRSDIKATTVRFKFAIDKRNGVMDPIIADRSLSNEPELIRCLYLTLGQMQFPFKKPISGTITMFFNNM